jgi:hypothetical protein
MKYARDKEFYPYAIKNAETPYHFKLVIQPRISQNRRHDSPYLLLDQ